MRVLHRTLSWTSKHFGLTGASGGIYHPRLVRIWIRRRGREVEGTPAKGACGQNLHQGFESLRLRQTTSQGPEQSGPFFWQALISASFRPGNRPGGRTTCAAGSLLLHLRQPPFNTAPTLPPALGGLSLQAAVVLLPAIGSNGLGFAMVRRHGDQGPGSGVSPGKAAAH